MSASSSDYFKKAKRKFSTTVGTGGISNVGDILPLTLVTDLDTDTAVIVVVDSRDTDGNLTPDLEEVIAGVVSGSTLISCIRGLEGTTAQAHAEGANVTMYFTESHWDGLINGILVEHNQDGTHGDITADSVTADTMTVGGRDVANLLPAGVVMPYAGTTAPTGYLICDGSSLLRATYPDLFAVIGTTYGAADSTHFTLPNPNGRVIAGKATSGTLATLGGTAGAETVNLSHSHGGGTGYSGDHSHSIQTNSGVYRGGQSSTVATAGTAYGPPGHDHDGVAYTAGGHTHGIGADLSTAQSVIQPTLVLNYIIKT